MYLFSSIFNAFNQSIIFKNIQKYHINPCIIKTDRATIFEPDLEKLNLHQKERFFSFVHYLQMKNFGNPSAGIRKNFKYKLKERETAEVYKFSH